jgi:hypothetical protein
MLETMQKDAPPLTVAEAADLRPCLQSFAEDWNRPDMDVSMPCKQGDVVLMLFPNSDLVTF